MRSRQFGRRFERNSGPREARPGPASSSSPPPRNKIVSCESDKACTPLRCAECLKRIPVEATITKETGDYVRHFCGLRCLHRWELRH